MALSGQQLQQEALSVPIFVGGEAAVRFHDEIVAAHALPLGSDVAAAVKRVAAQAGA